MIVAMGQVVQAARTLCKDRAGSVDPLVAKLTQTLDALDREIASSKSPTASMLGTALQRQPLTDVQTHARELVGYLVPLVEVLRRKCEGNPKVATEIGDALNDTTNAMMNLGKALDEAGVPKPVVGVELQTRTTRDDDGFTFEAGLRMRKLDAEDEAKLGGYDKFDKSYPTPEVAAHVRSRSTAIRRRLHSAVADNSPGDRIEDRRIDPLIDELAVLLAEVSWR